MTDAARLSGESYAYDVGQKAGYLKKSAFIASEPLWFPLVVDQKY